MIHLNLLSPQRKREVERRYIYDTVKRVSLILSVFLILITVFLVGARLTLQDISGEVKDSDSLITQRYQQDESSANINARLQGISKILDDFTPWSYFIEDIAKNAEQEIDFRNIEINKKEGKINIKGNSSDRGALLDFKHDLENSERFDKIIFPIENILKKKNVDFDIEIEVDPKNVNID